MLTVGRGLEDRGLRFGTLPLGLLILGIVGVWLDGGRHNGALLFSFVPCRIPILGLAPRKGNLPPVQTDHSLTTLMLLRIVRGEWVIMEVELTHHPAVVQPDDGKAHVIVHARFPYIAELRMAGLPPKKFEAPCQCHPRGLLGSCALALPVPSDQNGTHINQTPSVCTPPDFPEQLACLPLR